MIVDYILLLLVDKFSLLPSMLFLYFGHMIMFMLKGILSTQFIYFVSGDLYSLTNSTNCEILLDSMLLMLSSAILDASAL